MNESNEFKATEEQIKQIAANAVNASIPMGMGFLQATNKEFKSTEFDLTKSGLNLDYVQGRMVKLTINRLENNKWIIVGSARADYQSWVSKYPTNRALVESIIK